MKNSLIVIVLILVALSIALLYNFFQPSSSVYLKDPYTLYYEGDARHFRANLIEANKTTVYPNEDAIKNVLLGPDVYKVYIAYISNETENGYFLASSFEITIKMGLVYRHYFTGNVQVYKDLDGSSCLVFTEEKKTRCFKSLPINSTDELVPTNVEPIILLLGSAHANQTAVTVKNNLIIVEGKNFTQIGRNYNDLDLAVDKLLLVLMT